MDSYKWVLVLLALASLACLELRAIVRHFSNDSVRVWNVYHYYLGSKYSNELGYTDLYEASIKADEVGHGRWTHVTTVRDLHTRDNKLRVVGQSTYDPNAHFSPRRWEEFRTDLAALQRHGGATRWAGMLCDRGYNASPFWTLVGGSLANLAPATNLVGLKALCTVDLALLAVTLGVLLWSYGSEKAALVLILLVSNPVNHGRLVGGLLQYDWWCFSAIAFALYHRGMPKLAGLCFAYAVLTRVFPLVLLLGGAVPVVWARLRRRRSMHGPWARCLMSCVLVCALGFAVSAASTGEANGWHAFAQNLAHHAQHHEAGERRVGLKHLFVKYDLAKQHIQDTAEPQLRQEWAWLVLAAGLLVLLAGAQRNVSPHDAMILALVAVFAALVTSRYYYSYLALAPLLSERRARGGCRIVGSTVVALLGAQGVLGAALYYDASRTAAYVIYNAALTVVFSCTLVAIAWRRFVLGWGPSARSGQEASRA